MPRGRPPFQIDARRLLSLREYQNMTQLEVARAAARFLGTATLADRSLIRHYQKIEEHGRTSRRRAEALARALGVSVPVLQGIETPEPSEYQGHIQSLLAQQLGTGNYPALQRMHDELEFQNPAYGLEHLAEDIADRIEAVQLVRNPDQVAELVALTGLSESDLLAPANVKGHWFISYSFGATTKAEMAIGAVEVGIRVGEILQEQLRFTKDDTVVRMRRDKPWYRIEVEHPRIRRTFRIDFTRCRSDGKGLSWTDGSWRDDFWLEPRIREAAYAHADFVTDFSDKTSPVNLSRLCLIVTEYLGSNYRNARRMIVRRYFEELGQAVIDSYVRSHESKFMMAYLLRWSLRQALMPHLANELAKRTEASWSIRAEDQFATELHLATPRDSFGHDPDKPRYRITLHEETGDNEFSAIPVRNEYYVDLAKDIGEWLVKGDWPKYDDEPLPNFEPVPQTEDD
jgi:transcriptional regulator with XRE-family HTH domain